MIIQDSALKKALVNKYADDFSLFTINGLTWKYLLYM